MIQVQVNGLDYRSCSSQDELEQIKREISWRCADPEQTEVRITKQLENGGEAVLQQSPVSLLFSKQELENARMFIGEQARMLHLLSQDGMVAVSASPYYDQDVMVNAICGALNLSQISFSFDDRTYVIHLEE